MPLRLLPIVLALTSLLWVSGCDTSTPDSDPPHALLQQAEDLSDQARILTDRALFISRQGVSTRQSFELAYAGLYDDESLDQFTQSFDHGSRLPIASDQARLATDPSVAETFIREFGSTIADETADAAMEMAEAAMAEAERQFAGDTLAAVQDWVAFTYTAQRYLSENTWKLMLMAAREDGSVASAAQWDGWQFMLTQSGGQQPTPDDPPDPDAYAPTGRERLDRVLGYGMTGGTAGAGVGVWVAGLPTFGFGAPAGGTVGGFVGFAIGATIGAGTSGGGGEGTREYRIALDNWCRNTNNRSHVDHSLLCDD